MKALKTIQVLSKIGKILSKIVFVCCLIGAIGCTVGIIVDIGVIQIGGVTVHGLIVNRAGIDLNSLYPIMIGAMCICIGYAVMAKFAEKYFANELSVGTPFTLAGARELLRLGIVTISVPMGSSILAQIGSSIAAELLGCGEAFELDSGESVMLGVMFIVVSLLCRYGAEIKEEKAALL